MSRLTLPLIVLLAAPLFAAPAIAAPLTDAETKAALAALDDEYHAFAFYQAVIDKFGAIRPFKNIIKAEARHIGAVSDQLQASGVTIHANPYLDGTKPALVAPATVAEACKIGVEAEIANAALYDDKLLPAAAGNPELVRVFTSLRDASQQRHLPAFQRCAG